MSTGGWTWRYEDTEGNAVPDTAPQQFPSQSDAESWLGEEWRTLLDTGVDGVYLLEEDQVIYGPMSLRPTE
jgi:hypothetical protein